MGTSPYPPARPVRPRHTADQLQQHVTHELTTWRPPRRLVIDLAQTTFCDSTGVGALTKTHDAAAHDGVLSR